MTEVIIRAVEARDVDAVVAMVHELAAHEEMPEECHLEPPHLHRALFGERPALYGIVAELDGEVGGFALYFLNFSTWDGVHGIYAEDVYIRPALRGRGVARRIWGHLAQLALDQGYTRVECVTLRSNTLGMDVHLALGAEPRDDWRVLRWDGDALRALAKPRP
ncbi:MAG TPA: GNAT family N-acetyltransferase [Pseudonocardia sp.]|nr:GNAT family N-acetyltransferase [Pseudonocardia sp.]